MGTEELKEVEMFFVPESGERFFQGDLGMEMIQPDEEHFNFGEISGEFSCELSMTELEFVYLLYVDKLQKNNWRKMHGIPMKRRKK